MKIDWNIAGRGQGESGAQRAHSRTFCNLGTRLPISPRGRTLLAFSLLEIMIAVSIFFMAVFAILGLVSRSLAQARALQPMQIDANAVAAELSLTNRLEEGPVPDELIRHFEHMYPGYTCWGDIRLRENSSNLFEVFLEVGGVTGAKHVAKSKNTILLFRPMSQPRGPGNPGLPGRPGAPMTR